MEAMLKKLMELAVLHDKVDPKVVKEKNIKLGLRNVDGTGVCVLAKRLERGTFPWPQSAGEPGAKMRLAPQALQLLLDGVELKDAARRAWYEAAV